MGDMFCSILITFPSILASRELVSLVQLQEVFACVMPAHSSMDWNTGTTILPFNFTVQYYLCTRAIL